MADSHEQNSIQFHGQAGTLFGIQIRNLLLILVTLGIYSFWARVKVRNYLWGQFEFDHDRLSYHGTGLETFKGWLKAAAFFGIPYALFRYGPKWMGGGPALIGLGALLSILLVVLFFPMAVIGSRRYRLSRTGWRGIRFSFRKTWKDYIPLFWKGNFLSSITLSLYSPYYQMNREKFLVENTFIGDRHFDFDGEGKDLFKSYFIAFLLAIPTLFFSLFWYHVVKHRYIWNHTIFREARFNCTITFGGMLKIAFLNFLTVLFTLGFAYAWAETRSIRYMVQNLTLEGYVDKTLGQEAQSVNATGEELASFFDLDFDLG